VNEVLVQLDDSLRVDLRELGLAPHDRYLVTKEPDGRLIFIPVSTADNTELSFITNAALRERIEANRADPCRMTPRPDR
jgi:hypothetical protein